MDDITAAYARELQAAVSGIEIRTLEHPADRAQRHRIERMAVWMIAATEHDQQSREGGGLDTQLQETLENFERRKGVVASITTEKGFLDVLQNYTSYKLAFQLAQEGKQLSSEEVERSAALKKLMGWVKLHPHNIAQKVQIVVEHFRQFVWPLLDGKAKAMVVVGSPKEVLRWKLAIDKYIRGGSICAPDPCGPGSQRKPWRQADRAGSFLP